MADAVALEGFLRARKGAAGGAFAAVDPGGVDDFPVAPPDAGADPLLAVRLAGAVFEPTAVLVSGVVLAAAFFRTAAFLTAAAFLTVAVFLTAAAFTAAAFTGVACTAVGFPAPLAATPLAGELFVVAFLGADPLVAAPLTATLAALALLAAPLEAPFAAPPPVGTDG